MYLCSLCIPSKRMDQRVLVPGLFEIGPKGIAWRASNGKRIVELGFDEIVRVDQVDSMPYLRLNAAHVFAFDSEWDRDAVLEVLG